MKKFRYITYLGRDRDDWTAHYLHADDVKSARKEATWFWSGSGQVVKNNSFEEVDSQ